MTRSTNLITAVLLAVSSSQGTQLSAQDDRIAPALARVLASQANRTALVDIMKSSSRRSHAVDLPAFIRSLSDTTASADRNLLLDEPSTDSLELVLPVSWDRVTWEATDDIVVTSETSPAMAASDLSVDQFLNIPMRDVYSVGHQTDSSQILFLPTERLPYPLLVIRRTTNPDDEAAAIERIIPTTRSTVSTFEEEYSLTGSGTSGDRRARASWNGVKKLFTLGDCITEQNQPQGDSLDHDGILDICEYKIARAFRPRLMMDKDERHAGRQTYWEVRRPQMGDELTTQEAPRRDGQELWLFYALGYYYDGGRYGLSWHQGDSEFVIASVAPVGAVTDSLWALNRICFAAHWDAQGEFHECYDADDSTVQYYDGRGGRPRVWVAYNKHGSYPNAMTCRSHVLFRILWFSINERCEGRPTEDGGERYVEADVVIRDSMQLGQYDSLTAWSIDEQLKYRTGTERLWSREAFCGWHRDRRPCAGNYWRPLKAWGFVPDAATRR